MSKASVYVLPLGLALLTACAEKPVVELQQAREAVATALDLEADLYAPNELDMAQFNLESGEFAITEQDQAPAWGRNYSLSLDFLALAIEQAEQAQAIAETNKSNLFKQAENALPMARNAFQGAFEAVEAARSSPITRVQIQSFDDELAGIFATLDQAEEIYDGGDYSGAFILLQEIRERSALLRSRAQLIGDPANQ